MLQTGLTNFARDPITGAAADVVVVFRGGVGTLVELAYAAFENRPIVFCDSLEDLRRARHEHEDKLRSKLEEAIAGYPLIAANQDVLMEALTVSVTDQSRVSVSSAEEAVAAALRLTDGIRLLGQTHFRGLPGDADIKQAFEQMVIALSN